jgi:hypothetical protein
MLERPDAVTKAGVSEVFQSPVKVVEDACRADWYRARAD